MESEREKETEFKRKHHLLMIYPRAAMDRGPCKDVACCVKLLAAGSGRRDECRARLVPAGAMALCCLTVIYIAV